MAHLQAAPSINDVRTQAHLTLIGRLGALDLTPILVYRIDSVPAGALPLLGWQFDLLSPLWQLIAPASFSAESVTQAQRDLIKLAIPLHRARGTPYAIKTALTALGWSGVTVLEGQAAWLGPGPAYRPGQHPWPANEGWAVCRLLVPIPAVSASAPVPWDPSAVYTQGVSVTWQGVAFYASGAPVPGVPPQFASVDEITDVDLIADWDNLVSAGWTLQSALPIRSVGPADLALIVAAFNFFKPARVWLDSGWFVPPAMADAAPSPIDKLAISGIAAYGSDLAPAPAEAALTMSITMGAMAEPYPPIAPLYNAHYRNHGITYGANEPQVADSVLIVNGTVQGESQ